MMYEAELKLPAADAGKLHDALKPEVEDTARFKVRLEEHKAHVLVHIEATDASALKAAINSYLRLAQVTDTIEV